VLPKFKPEIAATSFRFEARRQRPVAMNADCDVGLSAGPQASWCTKIYFPCGRQCDYQLAHRFPVFVSAV